MIPELIYTSQNTFPTPTRRSIGCLIRSLNDAQMTRIGRDIIFIQDSNGDTSEGTNGLTIVRRPLNPILAGLMIGVAGCSNVSACSISPRQTGKLKLSWVLIFLEIFYFGVPDGIDISIWKGKIPSPNSIKHSSPRYLLN